MIFSTGSIYIFNVDPSIIYKIKREATEPPISPQRIHWFARNLVERLETYQEIAGDPNHCEKPRKTWYSYNFCFIRCVSTIDRSSMEYLLAGTKIQTLETISQFFSNFQGWSFEWIDQFGEKETSKTHACLGQQRYAGNLNFQMALALPSRSRKDPHTNNASDVLLRPLVSKNTRVTKSNLL